MADPVTKVLIVTVKIVIIEGVIYGQLNKENLGLFRRHNISLFDTKMLLFFLRKLLA